MSERFVMAAGVTALLALSAGAAGAQEWRTTTIMRQATNEDALAVEIAYGAGELRVEPADGRMLYQASVRYDAERFEPVASYSNGRLELGVDNHEDLDLPDYEGDDVGRLNLRLGRGVPLDLDFEFGAAMAEIDLGGLSVRSLDIGTGASETRVRFSEPNPIELERIGFDVGAASFTARGLGNANARTIVLNGGVAEMTLDFSGQWRGNTHLEAAFGLGSLTLRVPRDVGVHVHKETLLASFDAPRMDKDGNDYYSDNWRTASRRLTVDIDGAFGDISIDWIE
ncbi:MAG TPA: toast rack family protein [Longimicrobiales bacterium]